MDLGQRVGDSAPACEDSFVLGQNLIGVLSRGDRRASHLHVQRQSKGLIATLVERLKTLKGPPDACGADVNLAGASTKQLLKELLQRLPGDDADKP